MNTRSFVNELGNQIKITIEGPNSASENTLTTMEAENLRDALVAELGLPAIIKGRIENLGRNLREAETRADNARILSSIIPATKGGEDELHAISAAIGSVRFMDPPDGGDVSLAEQVSRMRQALKVAEAGVQAASTTTEVSEDDLDAIREFAAAQSPYKPSTLAHKLFVNAVCFVAKAWIEESSIIPAAKAGENRVERIAEILMSHPLVDAPKDMADNFRALAEAIVSEFPALAQDTDGVAKP